MGKVKERGYINNLARSIMGQLSTEELDGMWHVNYHLGLLYDHYAPKIMVILRNKMKPATLGRIAACAKSNGRIGHTYEKTTLFQVLPENCLSKRESGKDLLIKIACGAILAEIADIIKAEIAKTT